jgi:hypothetical protein
MGLKKFRLSYLLDVRLKPVEVDHLGLGLLLVFAARGVGEGVVLLRRVHMF